MNPDPPGRWTAQSSFRTLLRIASSLLLIAALTGIDLNLLKVNSATAAFTYLLAVLALATRGGLPESITASLAGMVCYNFFFLPPVGTLTVSDPQNWVALLVFLITAVTASNLSSSARQRAEEALARQQEMERLYELSRAMMLLDNEQPLAGQIAGRVLQTFGFREVAFFERHSGQTHRAGTSSVSEESLRDAMHSGLTRTPAGALIVPVNLGGRPLGSVGVSGGSVSEPALQAIANLAAIVLERGRDREAAARAEASRQNEQLKSTLLDALAHEFKTPLTSIKAAITSSLARYPHPVDEADLLSIVDEEADRMTAMVTESIEVARIEAGQLHLHPEPCALPELVSRTVERLRTFLDERPLRIEVPSTLPAVYADAHLIGLVLRQLIHNAVKYSYPSSPIEISATPEDCAVVICIGNQGVGIPEHEQEAIFDKFYRGRVTRERIPGTGLGLTIAREIIQAHGGRIWVQSQPGQGARFFFTLPAEIEINTKRQLVFART